MSSLRTRWSAIGAAVAITLGAGGLLTASAAGSVFIPISPTRVLDTRIPAGLPGPLTNSTPALLDVTGNIAIVNPDQTIGTNGNPVISYHDGTPGVGDLRLVASTNPTCTGTQTPVHTRRHRRHRLLHVDRRRP